MSDSPSPHCGHAASSASSAPTHPPGPPVLRGHGTELRHQALVWLAETDVARKREGVRALHAQWLAAGQAGQPLANAPWLDTTAQLQADPQRTLPGRPATPVLVDPAEVPTRSPHTAEGRAALLHAICHIEFNAINLALDAIWRFADMPDAYYLDWLRVAAEEAYHFGILHTQLLSLRGAKGERWDYGSFSAHDGLWAMCIKTATDPTARMALVPRTLEARGLDATPPIQAKLRKVGTPDALETCALLDIILRDEIGHVAIGNHWYTWLCQRHGLEPVAHYRLLARQHQAPRLKPPFNEAARKQAGFSDVELAYLLQAF